MKILRALVFVLATYAAMWLGLWLLNLGEPPSELSHLRAFVFGLACLVYLSLPVDGRAS